VVLLAKLVYATEATTAAPIEAPCFEGGEGVPQEFSSKDPCSYLKKNFLVFKIFDSCSGSP
jgi:hypothetical protein